VPENARPSGQPKHHEVSEIEGAKQVEPVKRNVFLHLGSSLLQNSNGWADRPVPIYRKSRKVPRKAALPPKLSAIRTLDWIDIGKSGSHRTSRIADMQISGDATRPLRVFYS
jgi:hypothetical protein